MEIQSLPRADALAGLTVAIVALPLSKAIAIASGATPVQGLYTAIFGGLALGSVLFIGRMSKVAEVTSVSFVDSTAANLIERLAHKAAKRGKLAILGTIAAPD